jgi:Tfp pilus assembly protein PilX
VDYIEVVLGAMLLISFLGIVWFRGCLHGSRIAREVLLKEWQEEDSSGKD